MNYKVKEVADIAGISVRTLHHYDNIELLKPESVNSAGYRLYSDKDLERLQQILFFKELDFTLEEIKVILDSPDYNRFSTLEAHKELLLKKMKRLEKIIEVVDRTMNSIEGESKMEKREMFEAFDISEIEEHRKKYAEETKQKYGNSEAYKESSKKTSKYTKEDWARIMSKRGAIDDKIIANMDKGPEDPIVQEGVAELRQHITDNFYNCTLEIFRGLAELYVQDERFTANIDKKRTGYAEFLRKAILVYCEKQD